MAVKAVNNSVGLNEIVPTLLVFGVYLWLTKIDSLSLSVIKRTKAIYVATKEVRRLYIERQVKDIFTIYNSPNTKITLDLPLQLNVHMWREKEGWKGLYKLIAINGEIYTVNML